MVVASLLYAVCLYRAYGALDTLSPYIYYELLVRRYLGMINQLSKFAPDLSSKTKPLRDLLSKKNQWVWGPSQQQAFADTKADLSSPRILALYNTAAKTKVSADASSFGLGGVLSQEQSNGSWQPISYISRSLTPTEQRYAQIEKECLAVTWACERLLTF